MSKTAFDIKVKQWDVLRKQLKEIKGQEMAMRLEIAAQVANGQSGKFKKEFQVGDDSYVVNFGTSLSVDKDLFERFKDKLTDTAMACFKFTVGLDKKKYTGLVSKDDTMAVTRLLIEKPSAPTIKKKGEKDDDDE